MAEKELARQEFFANFFSSVGVAWFAAGVIGIFVGQARELKEILFSLGWGIFFSLLFLFVGSRFLK